MPPPPDISAYILPATESQRIFTEEILTSELSHLSGAGHPSSSSSSTPPFAVLVAGQTGAGKTRLAPDLWSALVSRPNATRKAAHFIADVYKTYHPAYTSLVSTPGKQHLASPATGTDARKWLEMACQYAIDCRVDVLVESACRYPDDFKSLASAFSRGGYRVFVAIMAVPECLSLMGCVVRYFRGLKDEQKDEAEAERTKTNKMPLRLTPKKIHDDTYRGLVDVAGWVDAGGEVDAVVIVRRNGLAAYENDRGPQSGSSSSSRLWSRNPSSSKEALEMERLRPLDTAESASYEHDLEFMSAGAYAEADPKVDGTMQEVRDARKALSRSEGGAKVSFPELKSLDCEKWLGQHS